MRIEGNGGPIGFATIDTSVLDGVCTTDADPKVRGVWQECANPRCSRLFRSRQEGDMYCSGACDLDANPHYKGDKGK